MYIKRKYYNDTEKMGERRARETEERVDGIQTRQRPRREREREREVERGEEIATLRQLFEKRFAQIQTITADFQLTFLPNMA